MWQLAELRAAMQREAARTTDASSSSGWGALLQPGTVWMRV